jgi:hypothetical protein
VAEAIQYQIWSEKMERDEAMKRIKEQLNYYTAANTSYSGHNIANANDNSTYQQQWNSPYITTTTSYPSFYPSTGELKQEIDELKETVSSLLDLILDIVKEDCVTGEECGECIPCKARVAFLNEYKRTLGALASDG